ncbi:hypothetical protein ACIBTV_25630 [Micromonospora sp. NPDC049366]|uniref:hypothetical protein n=1 Tax=Micromonospora sp. NPDC049366 TaxID=3364271 RepID=UPI0037953E44
MTSNPPDDAVDTAVQGARPTTDLFIASIRETVGQIQAHDHPTGGDLFCLNLTSFLGSRMGAVLSRLDDAHAELAKLRDRNTALVDEFTAEAQRLMATIDDLSTELATATATITTYTEANGDAVTLASELAKTRAALNHANRLRSSAEADHRSAQKANIAFANEVAALQGDKVVPA